MDGLLRPAGDIAGSEIDGEIVMISITSGKYFKLDNVASEIWRQLEDGASPRTVTARLCEAFKGDPAVIEADVTEFLETLLAKGLIEAA